MPDKLYAPIRVMIADDHEVYREGFRVMLKKPAEFEVVGEAEDGLELLELAGKLQPEVIVTDIKMPKLDGVQATRRITELYPHIGIIAISMFDDDHLIVAMLEAGARGYLLKNAGKNEVFEAIKTVYRQETYYCHHTSGKLAQMIAKSRFNPHRKRPKAEFNEKEKAVIRLICQEYSNKEMAAMLYHSVRTIEGYREKIQEKMGVRNTAGIVVYAIKNGIYII
jgi:DNA-binding NarL/FixJ family response regulator